MLNFRLVAIFLGAFGAGVVTAGIFLSGRVEQPLEVHSPAPPPAASTVSAPANEATAPPLAPRSVRTIPFENPLIANPETTGRAAPDLEMQTPKSPAGDQGARTAQQQPSCNIVACSKFYHSFDSATCTYQPYDGGSRRLCEK